MSIPEMEILFNRYIAGEMIKEELTVLVKRLLLERNCVSGSPFRRSF